jgi:hypothetical protein
MVAKFKKGYYYKFIGDENDYYWHEDKKIILDGRWHKCVRIKKEFYHYAKFESMEYGWFWDYEDFIESKHPPELKVKMLLKSID